VANCQTITICREIVDEKTVVSKIKSDGVIVHVKSIFDGKKDISDIIYNIAKDKIKFSETA